MTTCTCDTFTSPTTVTTNTVATTTSLAISNNNAGSALTAGNVGNIETFVCTSLATSHYCLVSTNFSSTGGAIKGTANGTGIGVEGISFGQTGVGIKGTGTAQQGIGVYAVSTYGGGSNFSYAVRADGGANAIYATSYMSGINNATIYANNNMYGAGGYSGYFVGDINVVGTIHKSAGSFLIDHPVYPESKTLCHSFVESPDMMNVYNGNVVCDDNGEAVVSLPSYFEALNQEFRYQLTAMGISAPGLYVSKEVSGNLFSIGGAPSNAKVSWQITGIRQDKYALTHPMVVEADKAEEHVGLYLNPEAFGKTQAESIHAKYHEDTAVGAKS